MVDKGENAFPELRNNETEDYKEYDGDDINVSL